MGDWCGPTSDTDRLKTGARSETVKRREVDSMGEEKEILLRRNICAYLTSRLMGDPYAPALAATSAAKATAGA